MWGDLAVEDATLARHISTVRRALDERPDQHTYIVTVPGRGYEFVAAVTEQAEPVVATAPTLTGPAREAAAPRLSAANDPVRADSGSPWFPFALASVLAILVAGGALVTLELRRAQPRTTQRGLRQFTFHGGLQRQATWSPDGRAVAYTSDAAGSSDIWVQPLTDAAAVRVTSSPAEDSQPNWSPDGQALVFRSERDGGGL